jgi:hypothetical protein
MIKTFIFLNFIVSMFSDIVLNDLAKSNKYEKIATLQPYFKDKYILEVAIHAGITIVSCLLILILLSKLIFKFYMPNNFNDLLKYLIIAYPLGYLYDYLIYKFKIFGSSLDLYYEKLGVGNWGAIAFVFSIIISFFLQKYFIPIL